MKTKKIKHITERIFFTNDELDIISYSIDARVQKLNEAITEIRAGIRHLDCHVGVDYEENKNVYKLKDKAIAKLEAECQRARDLRNKIFIAFSHGKEFSHKNIILPLP